MNELVKMNSWGEMKSLKATLCGICDIDVGWQCEGALHLTIDKPSEC